MAGGARHPAAHRRPAGRALAAHPGAANGGVTRTVDAAERLRLLGWLAEVRRFVETTLLGLPIDAMLAIDHPDQLERLRAAGGDSGRWLRAADALGFALTWPRARSFLAFAAYGCDGEHPWPAGVWRDGAARGAESAPHSRRRQPQLF